MERRKEGIERMLGNGRLELMLTGAIVGALPLYTIVRGTEHHIPALVALCVAVTYFGMAIAGGVRDGVETGTRH